MDISFSNFSFISLEIDLSVSINNSPIFQSSCPPDWATTTEKFHRSTRTKKKDIVRHERKEDIVRPNNRSKKKKDIVWKDILVRVHERKTYYCSSSWRSDITDRYYQGDINEHYRISFYETNEKNNPIVHHFITNEEKKNKIIIPSFITKERKIDLVRVHERKTYYCSSSRRSEINKHDRRYCSSTNKQHNKDSSISKQ